MRRRALTMAMLLAALAGPAQAQTQTPGTPSPPALTESDVRELVEAARASAKAARENVDYSRVVPDLLAQMLNKLDKLENKLDKIENILRAQAPAQRRAPAQR